MKSRRTYILAELWPPPGWVGKLTYRIFIEYVNKRYFQEGELVIRRDLLATGKWVQGTHAVYPGKILGRFTNRKLAHEAKVIAQVQNA